MKDPAFLFYTSDFLTGTTFMSNEEVGKYIRTLCLLHQHGGKLPKEKIEMVIGNLSVNILEKLEIDKDGSFFSKRLLIETQKRNIFCESRRKNIMHRYEATSVKHMNIHMENENENEDVIVNRDVIVDKKGIGNKGGAGGKIRKGFVLPTIEEVETYCLERKNSVDPQKWHSWYTANGWRVGKNPMRDWRAAVRTWERKETAGAGWAGKGGRL